MNKLSLLAGVAIGVVITAGIAQTQTPPAATTTRPAVFVITEQTITDQAKYEDFAKQAAPTIKAAGGRFIARGGDVTPLAGEPPKRVVVLGFESVEDVKKWQAGDYAKLIPLRDQVGKWRSYAIHTCENPQGAKPGQTKCPN